MVIFVLIVLKINNLHGLLFFLVILCFLNENIFELFIDLLLQ